MARVLFKGVKQFTSDAWELVRNTDEVKHYLNLVRTVDDEGHIVEDCAQVWFGTRLYADLNGCALAELQEIINNIYEILGIESGSTLNEYLTGTTYINSATTITEALTLLDSALTQNIENIYEYIQETEPNAGPGITVDPSPSGATISVRLADNEQVLSFTGDGALHGEVRIKRIDAPDDDHYAAQYQLVDKDDNPIYNSATIDILKDQFLKRVLLTDEFETQEQIDAWCSANTIPDYAREQMHINNAYLVFEWELDLGPDAQDVDAETYTVIPVRMLLSSQEIVINGQTGSTESGVTVIDISSSDILTDRDAMYLESVDDNSVETYAVGVPEGTDMTTGFEDVMRVCLLYIDGNDVE